MRPTCSSVHPGFDLPDLVDLRAAAQHRLLGLGQPACRLRLRSEQSRQRAEVLPRSETGLAAQVSASAADLDFQLGLKLLDDVTLGWCSDGSAGGARASANLGKAGAMPTGTARCSSPSSRAHSDRSARQRQPDLPLYFPIKALRSAATPPTATATAFGDNVLHAAAGFSIDGSLDLHTQFDYSLRSSTSISAPPRC